jgi:hypothetical protein
MIFRSKHSYSVYPGDAWADIQRDDVIQALKMVISGDDEHGKCAGVQAVGILARYGELIYLKSSPDC